MIMFSIIKIQGQKGMLDYAIKKIFSGFDLTWVHWATIVAQTFITLKIEKNIINRYSKVFKHKKS